MAYQGPHAEVTQEFKVSPRAVAVEDLPPALVATAYDVFKKQNIGSHYGIIEQEIPWGPVGYTNQVVFDKDVIGQRGFDFYPPAAFVNSEFGQIDLETIQANIKTTGITVPIDKSFSVPGVEKLAGASKAIIPFYDKSAEITAPSATTDGTTPSHLIDAGRDFAALGVVIGDRVENTTDDTSALITDIAIGDLTIDNDIMVSGEGYVITRPIKILSTDLNTIIIPDGGVVTAQLKPGQKVFMLGTDIADTTTWAEIGTVSSIGADETKVNIATPVAAAITGSQIIIGSADATPTLRPRPNMLFDPEADFIALKVKIGDLLNYSSLSIAGSSTTPIVASITSILDKNTIKFNTELLATGSIDYDFSKYEESTEEPGSTINVNAYDIKRLVGFSENYGMKLLDIDGGGADGIIIADVTTTSFSYTSVSTTDVVPAIKADDLVAITDVNVASGTNERGLAGLLLYRVKTVAFDGTKWTVTFDDTLLTSDTASAIANGDFLNAWTPKNENDILSDFRAIRAEEQGVVTRIGSIEDIFTAFVRTEEEEIDPRNELAFMAAAAFQSSGGKVCYAGNVDSSAGNVSAEYADILEEFKLVDVYSHAFGSTDGGLNGTIAAYVNGQAEPYEAHERIGMVTYDQDDVYLMGTDNGSNTVGGLITISGSFNPITGGVTVKDKVKIYDSAGDFVEEVTVTETPTVANQVQTDGAIVHAAGHTYKFMSGRKDDQAIKIGALGLDERRVTVVWPGWFWANYGDERILVPPYFITATIAGMDSAKIASQSFTNLTFGIPGLSNIQLDTGTYFRKLQLDEMGGGGVDIMIQDATITQSIKSRHDLTSDLSSVQFQERSITKQADTSAKTIRASVSPYVGKYNITDNLLKFLAGIVNGVGDKLVKEAVIKELILNSVKKDEVIADKINFHVTARVFIAGNIYDITLVVTTD
jgi:hypothetical protein